MTDLKKKSKLELIKKAFRIWSKQYHFYIPREMLRMYIRKFMHERRNIAKYGCRYFEPEDQEQYAKWLSYRQPAARGKLRKDISRLGESETLDLSGIETEYVLVISDSCHSYADLF